MSQDGKTEDLANQDEKNKSKEYKAPSVSYEQLKMINVSQSRQLDAAQSILVQIANDLHEKGLALMNTSNNIMKLFQPPQTQPGKPGQNIQPQPPSK